MSRHEDLLLERLAQARHIYAQDVQIGAAHAVDAVINFLFDLDADPQLMAPLVGLSGGLVDAAMGISNPHVALAKHQGGPKTEIQESLAWACAAAAVTLFLEAGDTLPASARRVHVALGPTFPVSKLIEFRKRLTRGKSTVRPEAQENYRLFVTQMRGEGRLSARQKAESVLQTLRNMVATERSVPRTKV